MRILKFIRLFRRLFGPLDKLDAAAIEKMGLLAVKISQVYAVRGDLLGPEKVAKLNQLYEDATPMGDGEFKRAFEERAGTELKNAIAHLDDEPLAVASLGQVHRGRLKDGSEVVVKLLRKDNIRDFRRDVEALRIMARVAVFMHPPLARLADPVGTLESIVEMTETEMDLTAEVGGTRRLLDIRDEGRDYLPHLNDLSFPQILEQYTRSDIMVSEFIEAPSVRRLLDDGGFTYGSLLKLFRIHGYFLFFRGEFHGDFHPGNIFHDGKRFWFIDNANVEKVDPKFSQGLLRFMEALGRDDHRKAAKAIVNMSCKPVVDSSDFERKFIELYAGFGGKPIGEESLTRKMMGTVRLAVENGMEFPEGAFPMIKSLMYLDGMALKCAPEKMLLDDVVKFARDFRQEVVSGDCPCPMGDHRENPRPRRPGSVNE